MNQQKLPKKKPPLHTYAQFSGIAIQMLAIIGLGSYGGIKLDEAYPNRYHAYTIICSLAAVGIALYFVVKQVAKVTAKEKPSDD